MALAATTEWEVRASGSDNNGGGFDTASSGTDYSQQDAAQVAYTDLVIDATFNTKLTSAAHPFTAAHVGNIINVTGGTGFTTGRYQVVSVASNIATMDRAVGTTSSTGGTGNLGGGLQTLATVAAAIVAKNTIHVKSGTFTLTAAVAPQDMEQYWRGYQTAHNDRTGTRPLITTSTNSTKLFSVPGAGANRFYFENLHLTNTAGTRAAGIEPSANYPVLFVMDCVFDGFTRALNGGNDAAGAFLSCYVIGAEIKNCSRFAIKVTYNLAVHECYIHDNTEDGIEYEANNVGLTCTRTIFANNGRYAIITPGGTVKELSIDGCVFYQNGLTFAGNPFEAINSGGNTRGSIVNSIFYGGGLAYLGSGNYIVGRNNAVDSAGMSGSTYKSHSDQTLTADPFNNAAGGDFTLNGTAGGGAVCRYNGFQWS